MQNATDRSFRTLQHAALAYSGAHDDPKMEKLASEVLAHAARSFVVSEINDTNEIHAVKWPHSLTGENDHG